MSSKVRLFPAPGGSMHHLGSDAASARARVELKIAALSWFGGCLGPAASPMMAVAGLSLLCERARAYYEALTGRPLSCTDDMRWVGEPPPPDAPQADLRLALARARLALGATSYATSRHGADACIEFTRMNIGVLCGAAIAYCEALRDAPEGDPPVVDRTLHMDDGT